jgi:hypothetical protein
VDSDLMRALLRRRQANCEEHAERFATDFQLDAMLLTGGDLPEQVETSFARLIQHGVLTGATKGV